MPQDTITLCLLLITGLPLLAAGATFLGGCCGTTPPHIRALRDVVDNAALR